MPIFSHLGFTTIAWFAAGNLANRESQFASRSGNGTAEDGNKYTTVSAYSKIGFDSEKTALSKNQIQAGLKTGSTDYQN